MLLLFQKVELPNDESRLIEFLLSEPWPFHVNTSLTQAKVKEMLGYSKIWNFKRGLGDRPDHSCGLER